MKRLTRSFLAPFLVMLAGSCGDTTSTSPSQLNLDRPVDISFACYGGLRITHGIAARAGIGFIEIRSSVEGGVVEIRITNSGPPLSGGWNLHKQSRVGLRNTCERLDQLYAGEASLVLENGPADTVTASIRLPWRSA